MSNVTYEVLKARLENLREQRRAAFVNYRKSGQSPYRDSGRTIADIDAEMQRVEGQIDTLLGSEGEEESAEYD